jgi:hypothetical protein
VRCLASEHLIAEVGEGMVKESRRGCLCVMANLATVVGRSRTAIPGYLECQDARTDAGTRPYGGAVPKGMRRRRGYF